MDCPKCGSPCYRDEVHVGIGFMYGPYGCPCGWSEWPEYDLSGGATPYQDGGRIDQYGGFTPNRTKETP